MFFSSTILYNTTCIAHEQYTDIYPQTYISTHMQAALVPLVHHPGLPYVPAVPSIPVRAIARRGSRAVFISRRGSRVVFISYGNHISLLSPYLRSALQHSTLLSTSHNKHTNSYTLSSSSFFWSLYWPSSYTLSSSSFFWSLYWPSSYTLSSSSFLQLSHHTATGPAGTSTTNVIYSLRCGRRTSTSSAERYGVHVSAGGDEIEAVGAHVCGGGDCAGV